MTTHSARAEEAQFEVFPENWLAEGLTEFPFYSFYLGAPDINGKAFLPNFSPKMGSRLFYKGAGLAFTTPLPTTEAENYRRGQSDQTSFILTPYRRRFGFDLYYQHFKGFYEDGPFTEFSRNKPNRYAQLPEATVNNIGVNSYYVLKPESYSLAASFNQTEFQMSDGGSPLLSGFFNHLTIHPGEAFIPGSDPGADQSPPNLTQGDTYSLGGGAGYGYSFVKGRRYITLQEILGLGVVYEQAHRPDGSNAQGIVPALKINLNFSAAYNFRTFVMGAKFLFDSMTTKLADEEISSNLITIQLFFGGRF